MTKYIPQWYSSPIDLPERQKGTMRVRHSIIPIGEELNIVGMRQAFLRGASPVRGKTAQPLRVHELIEEGHGLWMTDLPEELNQIAEMLYDVRPQGRVLVGGLGLGIVATALLARPNVRDVLAIERSQDVVDLCRQPGYRVHVGDLLQYLEGAEQEPFDYYLLDTWQGTNECTWFKEVLPLRRAIRRRHGKRPVVHCWAEDIMLGQILRSLEHARPHWYYSYLPTLMQPAERRWFVRNVGLPSWEKKYGVAIDRYANEEKE